MGADLTGASLVRAILQGADLTGADLRSADLTSVKGLTQGQLYSAFGDEETTLSSELKSLRPVAWSIVSARAKGVEPTDAYLMAATGLTLEQLTSSLMAEEAGRRGVGAKPYNDWWQL
jgi:uncharacterized protein YjbI with pentapeptide repeats